MIDWIKTAQGWRRSGPRSSRPGPPCETSACRASCSRPSWHRFTAGSRLLEPFDRDTRLLVLDQTWWSANPLGMLWPELDAAFVTSGGGNGGPPAAARRPVVVVLAG